MQHRQSGCSLSSPTLCSNNNNNFSKLGLLAYFALRWGGLSLGLFILWYVWGSIKYVANPRPDSLFPIALSDLDNGDLILCTGSATSSRIIRTFSHSPWTHVGMVVRVRDRVYIAHADVNSDIRNYLMLSQDPNDVANENEGANVVGGGRERSEDRKKGVQINRLEDFVKEYGGPVYVRPIAKKKDRPTAQDIWRITWSYGQYTFQNFLLVLMRSVAGRQCWLPTVETIPLIGNSARSKQSFFCSQFLAQLMIELGYLEPTTSIACYHPCSFAPEYDGDPSLGMEFRKGQRNPFRHFTRLIENSQQ